MIGWCFWSISHHGMGLSFCAKKAEINLNGQLGKRMALFSIASPHSLPHALFVQSNVLTAQGGGRRLYKTSHRQWYLNWTLKDAMELPGREKRKAEKHVWRGGSVKFPVVFVRLEHNGVKDEDGMSGWAWLTCQGVWFVSYRLTQEAIKGLEHDVVSLKE